MKTPMFSSHKAPLSIIGVLTLITTLLGCPVNKGNKGEQMLVRKLDAVLLTTNDLPTMEVDVSTTRRRGGIAKQPPVVDGFKQSWAGTQPEELIYVSYWLFQSVADAENAAYQWCGRTASQGIHEPEPNAEDVIGDLTLRIPGSASIWFVKNNVLVYIMGRRPFINQLTFTRSVARKIETKINTALNQP